MDKVVGDLPPTKITNINKPSVVTRLADPLWNIPGPVDLLLGADVYYQIVTAGAETVKGTSFISTIIGFAISGLIESASTRHLCVSALYSTVEMELERFWKLEEVPDVCDSKGEQTEGVRLALCRSTEEKFDLQKIIFSKLTNLIRAVELWLRYHSSVMSVNSVIQKG